MKIIKSPKDSSMWLCIDEQTKSQVMFKYENENLGVIIHIVFVPKQFRRKGIGTKILEYSIKEIQKIYPDESIGIMAFPQEKSISLENLVKWYSKMGFFSVVQYDSETVMMVYTGGNKQLENELLQTINSMK